MTGERSKTPDQRGLHFELSASQKLIIAGLGVVGLGGLAGNFAWDHYGKTGAGEYFKPTVDVPAEIDNTTTIYALNAQNKIGQLIPHIRAVRDQHNPDAYIFMEGSPKGAMQLHSAFPEMHVLYRITDGKYNRANGGQALIAMSPQPLDNQNYRAFSGPGFLETGVRFAKGLFKDFEETAFAADPTLENSLNAPQESRLAMAFTIKAWDGLGYSDVRVVGTHVTPELEFQNGQLKDNINYVSDNSSDKRTTILCMDGNADPWVVQSRLKQIKFTMAHTGTTTNDKRTLDSCSYRLAEGAYIDAKARVLREKYSDHDGVLFSVEEPHKSLFTSDED